jgi:hypothetical protein
MGKLSFDELELDADVYYPLPNGNSITHKLPADMNRHERRTILRVVERCRKLSLNHPYIGRMKE